jgi:two-component system LytT family response regulator
MTILKETKIKTVIVDDEQIAREGLQFLLQKDPEIEIASICSKGAEAINSISKIKPDLVFLDIQMPEVDGFRVLQSIDPEIMPVIIFVTAYDQYALRAFEVNALDYLLKPFDDEKFFKTLSRAKDFITKSKSYDLQKKILALLNPHILNNISSLLGDDFSKPKYLSKISVKQRNETIYLNTCEIEQIEASDYYVTIHSCGKKYLLRETMNNLEGALDPTKFIRIHRSVILNIDRIKAIRSVSPNENVIITCDDQKFPISRTGKRKIKEHESL